MPADLRARLLTHRELIARARHEFLDLDLALALHDKLDRVLERWETFTEAERALIARTVHYLVDTDDEEHDLRSPIGFVDDAEQVDELLGRIAPDLLDG